MNWLKNTWEWIKRKTWQTFLFVTGAGMVLASTIPVVPDTRQWISYETSFEQADGTYKNICFDEFRGKDTIKKEIDCSEYHRRAHVKDYPNPVKLKDPNLNSRISLLGILTPKAEAAVAYDSITGSGDVGDGINVSVSFSHTAVAGGVIVVGETLYDTAPGDTHTNHCTFNGTEMFFNSYVTDTTTDMSMTIFFLPDTSAGAQTLFCEWDDATGAPPADAAVYAVNLTGADIAFPINVTANGTGSTMPATLTITSTVDNTMVVDFMTTEVTDVQDVTSGEGAHIERGETGLSGKNFNAGTTALITPAGATTTTWRWTGNELWRQASVAVKPDVCSTVGAYCTEIITTLGTSTWTSPANLTSIDVACWGAGGAGDGHASAGNGGGGGGAYASTTGISISGSTNYDVFLGTGGASAAGTSGAAGTRSHFFNGTTYSPIACAGLGATSITGAAGGTTACSVGSAAENAGGAGGNGTDLSDSAGGGGGAGGPNGTGTAGTNSGAAGGDGGQGNSTVGGRGGSGANVSISGSGGSGHVTGGGGGGGGDNGSPSGGTGAYGGGGGGAEQQGGNGGGGMCQISYYVPAAGGGGATPFLPWLPPLF